MEYFESDVPAGGGRCSDNSCPCPEVSIPRGEGYIYIDQQLVDSRRRYPSLAGARLAMQQTHQNMRAAVGSASMAYRLGPILVCEEGAKLRKLDLRVAAEDAKHWWSTGEVPLRATPIKTAETRIFKGHSIEEAKALAKKEIPEDNIDKIEVIADVKVAEKVNYHKISEKAVQRLKSAIPKEAFDIGSIEVLGEGKEGEADVKLPRAEATPGWLECWFRRYIPDAPAKATFDKVECIIPEKKFLGFVVKQGTWRIFWGVSVCASVTYKMPAEIEVYLKPKG